MSTANPCAACGGSWYDAMTGRHPADHQWTSPTLAWRQALAHRGLPCDLGRVVVHTPAACATCQGWTLPAATHPLPATTR